MDVRLIRIIKKGMIIVERIIDDFYNRMIGIRDLQPLAIVFPKMMEEELIKRRNQFLEKRCEKGTEENSWNIPATHYPHYARITNREKSIKAASNFFLDSMFLGMIAKFDAFIGELMKACIELKPDLMKSMNRELKFCDISSLSSIDEIKEYVIEKEVETTLRKSHIEHIEWFENKLGIKLTSDTDLIAEFIEVTETRNLFAHCDGVISTQYIEKCKEYSIDTEGRNVGEKYKITPEYFALSADIILDIGFKMANIIWRKLSNENIKKSDLLIMNRVYDLIDTGRYKPAIRIATFFADKKVTKDDDIYLPLLINLAQAHKWEGNDTWKSILKREHWNSKSNRFKIAKEVLSEEWDLAAKTMKSIGKADEVKREQFESWPLFREFRETQQFKDAYKIVYETDYEAKRQITSTYDLLSHDDDMVECDSSDDDCADG